MEGSEDKPLREEEDKQATTNETETSSQSS